MLANAFNIQSAFWLLAGILIGVGATVTLNQLWRRTDRALGRKRAIAFAGAGIAAMATVAVLIYGMLGRPDLLDATAAASTATNPNGDTTQSMEAVTAKLAERLARDGGSDAEWQLLAQSFDFMGRSEEAERARQHVVDPASQAPPTPSAESQALLATARTLRLQRKYEEARTAYESAISNNGMTADGWADYADVLASLNSGRLGNASELAIDRALMLEPNHAKALWLKASLAHDERRYADSLAIWKQLRTVIGANESDARIIDANIAEAEQLAATAPGAAASVTVRGTVDIDPKLLARAKAGATLFVYAKAANSPGPPLAVWKTPVGKWPIDFKLDDSMAMMPTRTLSSATDVIVEARISQSGQANAAAGDLQASGSKVNPREGKAIRLRIDKEVG